MTINGWDERDYKLWSALGVLPSYGRVNRTDHLVSLAEVEALLEKHAEERFNAKHSKIVTTRSIQPAHQRKARRVV